MPAILIMFREGGALLTTVDKLDNFGLDKLHSACEHVYERGRPFRNDYDEEDYWDALLTSGKRVTHKTMFETTEHISCVLMTDLIVSERRWQECGHTNNVSVECA